MSTDTGSTGPTGVTGGADTAPAAVDPSTGSDTTRVEDAERYRVVLNDEEQYALWPADRDDPGGWRDAGFTGSKEECMAHVDRVWTDMRPRSLREAMGG